MGLWHLDKFLGKAWVLRLSYSYPEIIQEEFHLYVLVMIQSRMKKMICTTDSCTARELIA